MGMFDYIKCDVPLPDGFTGHGFQSKHFACELDKYTITADGRLVRRYVSDHEPVPESEWQYKNPKGPLQEIWHESSKTKPVYSECDMNFHGVFNFYTSSGKHDDGTFEWHEYTAKFTDGKLVKIEALKKDT
jgi:hypothetical protein